MSQAESKLQQYDVLIIGGGMVGLTLACALGQSALRVAVIEAYEPQDLAVNAEYALRVSAINKSSQQVFEHIQAWPGMLQRRACAYQQMHVWDATGDGKIHFDAADLGTDGLGHIIENRVVQYALYEQARQLDSVQLICPAEVSEIDYQPQGSRVSLRDGRCLSAPLLVGADGAQSAVRQAAQIELEQAAYQQKGVVAIVKSTRHHQDTAWQRFLPSGPLAFLPLSDGRCSIVWSADDQRADELLAMDEQTFCRELAQAFDYTLGEVEAVSARAAFPLVRRHATHYVKPGLALIGDAAHTIHPLAGQGVNLGILDAAALAEVLLQARSRGQKLSSITTLRKYERWRRADNSLMMYSMSGFKNLFSNQQPGLSLLRNAGLDLVNGLGPIKHRFMRHAMGLEGDLPQMARPFGW